MKKFLSLLLILLTCTHLALAQGGSQGTAYRFFSGTLAQRSTSCRFADAYAASDTGHWYLCTATNTWTDMGSGGSGSGTVNSGTGNQLAYYSSTGTAVSGLTTGNNGVLVTNGSGVP